jgi:hypothetical protein
VLRSIFFCPSSSVNLNPALPSRHFMTHHYSMPPVVIHSTEVQVGVSLVPSSNFYLIKLCERKGRHPPTSFISILSNDLLFELFICCRLDNPFVWDKKWWYQLMHTCRRWRHIILDPSTSLKPHFYCTYDTPMAEMLKFSPPLPLDIGFYEKRPMSTKGEGALLVLQQHHRVRLISLSKPGLGKLFTVMDKPFPMLEGLTLRSQDSFVHSRLPKHSQPHAHATC